ncbi:MAG: host attachment protein [Gammaproteobacteria bacterium CG_4_10_14_0_8_um_filter_38_16]|nr:MAG: host attachment protein [Gammaproteobacteria bacterium CG_4_10_14_0_8_um_filter_38_16]PJA02984.1 MAG: host attachment protein [Gammaproteobacteria bacterium CG_4_10_14_0_2_um_filter_38_22]PJB09450.1 MAG: host attachment protein [Gammaproteobacteria bacterium CG_4_9_14_3_um_filter_38_9]
MIWIVTTNSNLCRIYEFDQHTQKIALLKEMNHPENREKTGDNLTSDKPGHYNTMSSLGGAYAPHSDPKEVEVDRFSREIAEILNHGRNTQAYKKWVLITPDYMNGLISKHMDKHVKELIWAEIHKDVMHLPEHELQQFIQENI